ncbi:uncharacterized protein PgNI_09874 [Pyricularia grisea]|uniref:Uncharacterized protein n=1 Tax=Pyricularia grisea TaxID=148305 RepID=A0A6P8AS29_PYRGI|nr:uncharacterized protein PgNI_09874 [Pyricularia grisea]TLD04925.1 hypothetical protein PgNI_09874 [Pyricularia grisea]
MLKPSWFTNIFAIRDTSVAMHAVSGYSARLGPEVASIGTICLEFAQAIERHTGNECPGRRPWSKFEFDAVGVRGIIWWCRN